jgi:hypothetical protein
MRKERNEYAAWVGNWEGRNNLKDRSVDRRIILNSMLIE